MEKYNEFFNKTLKNAPDFLIIKEGNEIFLSFDYFVNRLSDKAMPWLFKVYMDKKFNIIVEDEITDYIKNKFSTYNMKIKNVNGNIFLNKDLIIVILTELIELDQIEYDETKKMFSLK